MQQYLDIPASPAAGGRGSKKGAFTKAAARALRAKDFVRVGVECEIAGAAWGRDLVISEAPFYGGMGRRGDRGPNLPAIENRR